MRKRSPAWLLLFLLLFCGIVLAADRPNVLLILTDDQGWGDLGSHGNEQIDTPTMDRLAASGVRFDRFFVSPMCGPTRASLLTGRYNLRTGASWVSHGKEILRLDEVTLADAMAEAGYATGCFGKWHNGEYGPYHPSERGFQEFLGFCRGAWENYFDAVLERNRTPVQTEGYITDVLTDGVLEFIEQNRERPFCYVPYNAPHHPYQVPRRYQEKYLGRGLKEKTACVYGMVENIDDNLARILARLEEWKLADNTIVIFLSDNGPWGVRYNGNMRGTKASVDEGGVRVPFFIHWPGHIEGGRTVREIAAHIDLFSTILDLCGVPMPRTLPQDGRSLVPLLEGTVNDWPDRTLFFHQNRFGETHLTPGSVRTERYRLANRKDAYELYDMLEDPGQKRDIAREFPEKTKELAAAYEAWYQDVTSRGVAPPPLPIGHQTADGVALQAEDSKLGGQLKFRRVKGWGVDSVLNWTSPEDVMIFDIDVLQTGKYEIALRYGCLEKDLGGKITIQAGGKSGTRTLRRAQDPVPVQPEGYDRRKVLTSGPVPVMTWISLPFEPIHLEKGITKLAITARGPPADSGFEIKEAHIRLAK